METEIFFTNKRGIRLSGLLNVANNKAGIIFLHGFAGNKKENGLFDLATNLFAQSGYSTLRFDFQGAGNSDGDYSESTLKTKRDDFTAAIDYFIQMANCKVIGIIGFSLGATVAVYGYDEMIKVMALWSPALFPEVDMYSRYNTSEIRNELQENGFISKAGLKVGSELIQSFGSCNLVPYMKRIKCQTLLIHGDKDQRINHNNTIKAKNCFPAECKVEIIKGAGHSYKENRLYREKVVGSTLSWFNKNLAKEENLLSIG